MKPKFSGFSPQTAEFLMGIALNNNKAYFESARAEFMRYVKQPLMALAHKLEPLMQAIDQAFETRPVQGKALARLRRDTRFTRDKSPYRDHLWLGYRRPEEGNTKCLCFFFDVSAFAVSWGMGMYAPYRPRMDELRENILKDPDAFLALARQSRIQKRFKLEGETYKRFLVQEGDALVKDWCNRKSVALTHKQPLDASAFSPQLARAVEADFVMLAPLYRLLRGMSPKCIKRFPNLVYKNEGGTVNEQS